MIDYYSPGNLAHVVPYLPREPKWLLLGGPADAAEAQEAVKRWSSVKVIGVEPNSEAVAWQLANGWPKGHPLIHAALHDRCGTLKVASPKKALRSTRVAEDGAVEVRAVTWDSLNGLYGPFCDALLWMDIETHELEALRGAERLLAAGAILLVNVEMQASQAAKNAELEALLHHHGFTAVKDWNDSHQCWDRVWVRRPL